jgi:hypothetical protein
MRFATTALLSALLLAFGAAPATADGGDYDARKAHAAADKNKDGSVDRGEFRIRMVEVFYHADTNKDGVLVLVELQAIDEGMVHSPADHDRDQKLDLSEYVDHRYEGFDAADKNSDGRLSVEEVVEAYGAP